MKEMFDGRVKLPVRADSSVLVSVVLLPLFKVYHNPPVRGETKNIFGILSWTTIIVSAYGPASPLLPFESLCDRSCVRPLRTRRSTWTWSEL